MGQGFRLFVRHITFTYYKIQFKDGKAKNTLIVGTIQSPRAWLQQLWKKGKQKHNDPKENNYRPVKQRQSMPLCIVSYQLWWDRRRWDDLF
jgi:hypothetical protein